MNSVINYNYWRFRMNSFNMKKSKSKICYYDNSVRGQKLLANEKNSRTDKTQKLIIFPLGHDESKWRPVNAFKSDLLSQNKKLFCFRFWFRDTYERTHILRFLNALKSAIKVLLTIFLKSSKHVFSAPKLFEFKKYNQSIKGVQLSIIHNSFCFQETRNIAIKDENSTVVRRSHCHVKVP